VFLLDNIFLKNQKKTDLFRDQLQAKVNFYMQKKAAKEENMLAHAILDRVSLE